MEKSKVNADERVTGVRNEVKKQRRGGGRGGEICEEIAADCETEFEMRLFRTGSLKEREEG